MPLYIAQSGDLDRCYQCLTHSQTLKDSVTQLLIKYKSGALVTQLFDQTVNVSSWFNTFVWPHQRCEGKLQFNMI